MSEYLIQSAEPVSAEVVAEKLYAAYDRAKDPEAESRRMLSGGEPVLYVTEGMLSFPDTQTSFGQRPIVFEISAEGGLEQSKSFTVKAGSSMKDPEKLEKMAKLVQATLQGN